MLLINAQADFMFCIVLFFSAGDVVMEIPFLVYDAFKWDPFITCRIYEKELQELQFLHSGLVLVTLGLQFAHIPLITPLITPWLSPMDVCQISEKPAKNYLFLLI